MKKLKKLVENENLIETPLTLSNNVDIWVVTKSQDPMCDPVKLCTKTDPVGFSNQVRDGLLPQDVLGFYSNEEEATSAAQKQVNSVFETASTLEQKKIKVTDKIQKKINKLQREVSAHLKASRVEPDNADSHEQKAEECLSKIKELRGKFKMVETSKQELKRVEEQVKVKTKK